MRRLRKECRFQRLAIGAKGNELLRFLYIETIDYADLEKGGNTIVLQVWITECGCLCDEELFQKLLHEVSETRRAKVEKNKTDGGRRRSLAAGILLKHMLAEHGIREEEVVWENGRYGKPYLSERENGGQQIYVNISHSGKLVAGIIADVEVGIDVERVKDLRTEVARRFFTPEECAYIGTERNRFYQIWTLKEAFIKTLGGGMSIPLTDFEVLGALEESWAAARWVKEVRSPIVYLQTFPLIEKGEAAYALSIGIQDSRWQTLNSPVFRKELDLTRRSL